MCSRTQQFNINPTFNSILQLFHRQCITDVSQIKLWEYYIHDNSPGNAMTLRKSDAVIPTNINSISQWNYDLVILVITTIATFYDRNHTVLYHRANFIGKYKYTIDKGWQSYKGKGYFTIPGNTSLYRIPSRYTRKPKWNPGDMIQDLIRRAAIPETTAMASVLSNRLPENVIANIAGYSHPSLAPDVQQYVQSINTTRSKRQRTSGGRRRSRRRS